MKNAGSALPAVTMSTMAPSETVCPFQAVNHRDAAMTANAVMEEPASPARAKNVR